MRIFIVMVVGLALAPPLLADEGKKTATKTIQVPYRLTATNHVLVRVKLNGKGPYNFILDTGAPAMFVNTATSARLGVKPDMDRMGTFERVEFEGGVVLNKVKGRVENPFQLEGMNALGLAGAELHGMIGYTILARYRLEFDFNRHKMGWTPLNFSPDPPEALGQQGAAGGLDAIGSIMKLLGALAGKRVEPPIVLRGFLGIGLEKQDDGLVVTSVLAASPAAEAGLKVGDRISRFQGRTVSTVSDVHRAARKLAPNEAVQLSVTRGSEVLSLKIVAGRGL